MLDRVETSVNSISPRRIYLFFNRTFCSCHFYACFSAARQSLVIFPPRKSSVAEKKRRSHRWKTSRHVARTNENREYGQLLARFVNFVFESGGVSKLLPKYKNTRFLCATNGAYMKKKKKILNIYVSFCNNFHLSVSSFAFAINFWNCKETLWTVCISCLLD